MNLSVQLYSARKFTPLEAQLRIAADAGFTHVETFGPLNDYPASAARLFASFGLVALSAHIALDIVVGEIRRALDIAGALGARYVIAPYLPPERRPSDSDGWLRIGEGLARAAEIAAAESVTVGWHNHDFEFRPLPDGSLPIRHVLGQSLAWAADLSWVARGGADPLAWLNAYAGRVPLIHAKDLAPAGEKADEDGWAHVGAGVLPWPALFRAARAAGAQTFVAEHDNPNDFARFAIASAKAMKAFDAPPRAAAKKPAAKKAAAKKAPAKKAVAKKTPVKKAAKKSAAKKRK